MPGSLIEQVQATHGVLAMIRKTVLVFGLPSLVRDAYPHK
jgi:hypothetical protein